MKKRESKRKEAEEKINKKKVQKCSSVLDEVDLAGVGIRLLPVEGQGSELIVGDRVVVVVVVMVPGGSVMVAEPLVVVLIVVTAATAGIAARAVYVRRRHPVLLLQVIRPRWLLARPFRPLQRAHDLLAHAVRCSKGDLVNCFARNGCARTYFSPHGTRAGVH